MNVGRVDPTGTHLSPAAPGYSWVQMVASSQVKSGIRDDPHYAPHPPRPAATLLLTLTACAPPPTMTAPPATTPSSATTTVPTPDDQVMLLLRNRGLTQDRDTLLFITRQVCTLKTYRDVGPVDALDVIKTNGYTTLEATAIYRAADERYCATTE